MTPAETLLSRLECVKETGPSCWLARCPAHEDRTPSLSIRELPDGTLLVKDFAGCDALEIVRAVGLNLRDLFPQRLEHRPASPRQRRRYGQALEALGVIAHESLIVTIAADQLAAGVKLNDADRDRLHLARAAIQRAFALAGKPLPEPPCAATELKPAAAYFDDVVKEFEQGANDEP